MNSLPKISIITVAYNSDKTINNTIESVLSQQYDNIEYIIRKNNGYLQKKPINFLFKSNKYHNKHFIWLPLMFPLKRIELKAIDNSLQKFYPNTVPVNVVVRKNKKRDFVKCGDYIIKLLHDIDVVKLLKPTCFNDPINCIQQEYKNSIYLPLEEYYDIKKLIVII